MTALKYLTESKVATTKEILDLKREHPKGFDALIAWCKEEMAHNNIPVDEPPPRV